ncbi:MAG: hypothetical protein U0792_13305 [Gemmataceae bacterium]
MTEPSSRRAFLKTSAASAVASSVVLPGAYAAAGNETVRIGLIGCGGRGSGAAREALRADPKVKLVAMCDAFMDRLQAALGNLKNKKDIAEKIDVTPDRCFTTASTATSAPRLRRRCRAAHYAPGFRPIHPSGRGSGQACLLREARGGRCSASAL